MSNNIQALLAQADKARGFPTGTMASVMQQETGGDTKYLQDPSTYHYGLNAQGKRIAGHTGQVSTAFGPFGILESTGRDPGYGVKPLQNKSLEEQVRFAGDYLAARTKGAGSLEAGLAGYGEGGKYGRQVMSRIGKGNVAPVQVPVMAQANPQPQAAPPQILAQAPVQTVLPQQVQLPEALPLVGSGQVVVQAGPDEEWAALQQAMPKQLQASDLDYGQQMAQVPRRVALSDQPDFSRFKAWGARV